MLINVGVVAGGDELYPGCFVGIPTGEFQGELVPQTFINRSLCAIYSPKST
uniref:Uncharacterized protein n=1 Tax=Anguilla anguilla TaxID=7936 RepID=A0A0E9PBI7_ANGAN